MGLPETVDFARNFAVLVRIQGPDPKGLKMRKHAFHQYHSGKTTLSASGMLLSDALCDTAVAKRLWDHNALVLTVASVVEPFLTPQYRTNASEGRPELIPGAQIGIMLEGNKEADSDKGAPSWVAAQLLRMVDVTTSSFALQSLVGASSGSSENAWEVGWSLASSEKNHQLLTDAIQAQNEHDERIFLERQRPMVGEPSNLSLVGRSTTRIAVLGVNIHLNDLPNIGISPLNKRGEFILAAGSPFGVLSPVHFFNSISVGSISNCFPPNSPKRALLMADIRCLPGMEGGPVFSEHAKLVGILIRPLRQKSGGAEIQLVIPWEAIATACSDLLLKEPKNEEKGIHINEGNLYAVGNELLSSSHHADGPCCYNYEQSNSSCPSLSPVEKAMASICLITVDDGIWASGVVLNDQGLILTNAHLLEPWRFGKTTVNGQTCESKANVLFSLPGESAHEKKHILQSITLPIAGSSAATECRGYNLSSHYQGNRNIRVRLDHVDPWVWCDAKVIYICKGSLDVALLQLEYVPNWLSPIIVDSAQPSLGSEAHVIGHGLLGPRCGLSPSVCSGVVAKIVKTEMPLYDKSDLQGDSKFPVMLETTAAVHPGGSGGAVVNADGHMIGLVTSNARHGGGTVIPHLNFSIPVAVLAPIFEFSRGMQDLSLLESLDRPNEQLSSIWALMPSLSPKKGPSLPQPGPEDSSNDSGKGSRFAKFMAERQELLKRQAQLGTVERLPSKL